VALCQARISTKPLWGFSSSNPYHSQSRAEHLMIPFSVIRLFLPSFHAWKIREGVQDIADFQFRRKLCVTGRIC
jgi:hypothetical protein